MARRHCRKKALLQVFEKRVDKQPWQIYSLIFGTIPFHQYLGRLDLLIEQVIDFVEELPTEWQQQWDHIQQEFGLALGPKYIAPQCILSLHIPDKSPSWKSTIPLIDFMFLLKVYF